MGAVVRSSNCFPDVREPLFKTIHIGPPPNVAAVAGHSPGGGAPPQQQQIRGMGGVPPPQQQQLIRAKTQMFPARPAPQQRFPESEGEVPPRSSSRLW